MRENKAVERNDFEQLNSYQINKLTSERFLIGDAKFLIESHSNISYFRR